MNNFSSREKFDAQARYLPPPVDDLDDAITSELLLQAKRGSEVAINRILRHCNSLINSIINKSAQPRKSCSDDELSQIARVAVLDAIKTCDIERTKTFRKYAARCVGNAISKYVAETRSAVYIPIGTQRAAQKSMRRSDGDPPTAAATDEHVRAYLTFANIDEFDPACEYRDQDEEDDQSQIPHSRFERPDLKAERTERETRIKLMIDLLEPREAQIIKLKFYQELSLTNIGQVLGISGERARQIYVKAIRNLRNILSADNFFDTSEVCSSGANEYGQLGWKEQAMVHVLDALERLGGRCPSRSFDCLLETQAALHRQVLREDGTPKRKQIKEIAFFIKQHLLSKKLVRPTHDSQEYVVTAAGFGWKSSFFEGSQNSHSSHKNPRPRSREKRRKWTGPCDFSFVRPIYK